MNPPQRACVRYIEGMKKNQEIEMALSVTELISRPCSGEFFCGRGVKETVGNPADRLTFRGLPLNYEQF